MKNLKMFEEFKYPYDDEYDDEYDDDFQEERIDFNPETDKIEISTSSHESARDTNAKAYDDLHDLLFNEKLNPYYNLFNQEDLSLDDTEGFVGILDNAEEEDFNYVDMMKLNNFIRDYLKYDDGLMIVIGDFSFTKYIYDSEIEKYEIELKSKDFNI